MTDHGSNESLYKSASSSEGDLENREAFFDPLQRPNFLSGTSESSLIQVSRVYNSINLDFPIFAVRLECFLCIVS